MAASGSVRRTGRATSPRTRLILLGTAIAAVCVLAALWLWFWRSGPGRRGGAAARTAAYVGSPACASCHGAEYERWVGSHHQRAMLLPTEENVLADFGDAVYTHQGVSTRFSKKERRFVVTTDGPDGKPAEYVVKYVIGVDPVQQYIVEFPGGKLQCLTVAWDVSARRWYTLYPDQRVALDDPLHWSGRYQNWNLMCGDCHTTGYRKGYDAAADAYATEWSEFDVGCEACHGPGSAHVKWAEKRGGGAAASMGLLVDLKSADGRAEIDGCAPCHSRRHRIGADRPVGDPLLDEFMPELVRAPLYHADGQMLDEVYEYGSFRQSKMYERGVRCSDCHDPHSGRTKMEGNALCLSCHGERPNPAFPTLPSKAYDSPAHHFHKMGTGGAECVSCHMTTRNYMVVDERHDHFFRVPRPDESARWGTPNACNTCHGDKTPAWAAAAVERWYGPGRQMDSRFVAAVSAGQADELGAEAMLTAVAADTGRTAMARATALDLLRGYGAQAVDALTRGAAETDPIVRATAAGGLEQVPFTRRIAIAAPLLRDPIRAVRVQAARVLASIPSSLLTDAQRRDLDDGLAEYRQGLLAMADMPSTHLNLAVLESDLGRNDLAEQAYRKALQMDPYFLPARQNLATLYSQMGRNADAERELREGIRQLPDQGELHYALGLLLAEGERYDEAVRELRDAARLLPNRARVRYNLGLILQRQGRAADAERALLEAGRLAPLDPNIAFAIASFYAQEGRWAKALPYAERFQAGSPRDERARTLLARIQAALGGPSN